MKKWSVVFLALLAFACDFNADILQKEYPLFSSPSIFSETKYVIFLNTITHPGSSKILRYGCVWSMNPNPDIRNHRMIMNGAPPASQYGVNITEGLTMDYYWIRAYLETEHSIVYGNPVRFHCRFRSKQSVDDFYPESGTPGDSIILVGKNLNLDGPPLEVYLGDVKLAVVSVSENKLVVLVPSSSIRAKKSLYYVSHESSIVRIGEFEII